MDLPPLVVLLAVLVLGVFAFWFLNRHGLIPMLWLTAWLTGLGGIAGLLFNPGTVPVLFVLCSIVAATGAGVLEFLRRAEKR